MKTLVYPGDTLAALVAEARWKKERLAEEVPTLLEYLEREARIARDTAFRLLARREKGAEYWTGYADALEDLLKKIQRREVMV